MDLESYKKRRIDETEEFKTFSEEIDYLIKFFISFSDLITYNGTIISFITDKQTFNLDTTLIDSASKTLKSIKHCCSIGSFSDANTLIRKLRDDLIQYVFILTIIENRETFIVGDLVELKQENLKEFIESLSNLRINETLNDDEKAVSAWFNNTVFELKYTIRKKLGFENYMKVLKQNPNIIDVLEKYNLQKYWETLRKRLNDYVHNNGIGFSMHNSIKTYDKNLKTHLKNIIIRTDYISSFFMIVLLMVNPSLIMSTDYIDHIDLDLKPPEDSQYYVAPFIQEFLNLKITKLHPELKNYLKDYNIYGMKIE